MTEYFAINEISLMALPAPELEHARWMYAKEYRRTLWAARWASLVYAASGAAMLLGTAAVTLGPFVLARSLGSVPALMGAGIGFGIA